jgi:hypothetical protein
MSKNCEGLFDEMTEFDANRQRENLLLAVGIASFDMLSGIKVCSRWLLASDIDGPRLEDVFKITLSNVHRQPEDAYAQHPISTVEIQSFKWFITNSIFIVTKKPRSIYYSVGLVFDTRTTPETPHFTEILIYWCKILSTCARSLLNANSSLDGLKYVIDSAADEISIAARNSISIIPPIDLHQCDSRFYNLLLTSHLQTQMTTVIEIAKSAISREEAVRIARFLAHFELPFQRQLSTLSILPKPSPHLYVQVVERQSSDYVELMLSFGRPVTWVRLSDRTDQSSQILRSMAQITEQRVCHESYIKAVFVDKLKADAAPGSDIPDIKGKLRVEEVTTPAPWAIGTIFLINSVPPPARPMICEQQLGAILRIGISIVAIHREKFAIGGADGEIDREVYKSLKLPTVTDFDMALGVAHLYDKDLGIPAFDPNTRRIAARQMASY